MALRALVTPHLLDPKNGPHLAPLESAGFEIAYPPSNCDTLQPGEIEKLLTPDTVAMLASTEPLTREVLSGSSLRIVARLGVGFDSVDIQAATDLGIAVTITPGTLEASVAEQVLGMLLGITRGIRERDNEVRQGVWKREPLPRLAGRTFAMIGCGRIGREVVPRILGLGMKVLIYDPGLRPELLPEDDRWRHTNDLAEIWATGDVISLHAPCNTETENLINADSLRQMKSSAILLNTSRGGLVNEDDLAAALMKGEIWAAGLDVFREEPLPTTSPLLDCPNLLCATHVAGIDLDSSNLAGALAAQCIADIASGIWPDSCLINPKVKTNWRIK